MKAKVQALPVGTISIDLGYNGHSLAATQIKGSSSVTMIQEQSQTYQSGLQLATSVVFFIDKIYPLFL